MVKQNKKRWDILEELLKNKNPKMGAEIGVLSGRMTVEVLDRFPSIKMYYVIDPWTFYPTFKETLSIRVQKKWNQDFLDTNFETFKQNTKRFGDKIKVLKMFSSEAAKHITDASLDFAFVDGNHGYKYVKEDIGLYLPKIKKGGLLGGHDYGHIAGDVKKAVDEIFFGEFFLRRDMTWWVYI